MPLNPGDVYRDEYHKVWRRRLDPSGPFMSDPDNPLPLIREDVVWVTKDTKWLLLSEMETTHLRNCLAQMLLRADGWRAGYLEPIVEELKGRDNT